MQLLYLSVRLQGQPSIFQSSGTNQCGAGNFCVRLCCVQTEADGREHVFVPSVGWCCGKYLYMCVKHFLQIFKCLKAPNLLDCFVCLLFLLQVIVAGVFAFCSLRRIDSVTVVSFRCNRKERSPVSSSFSQVWCF